MGQFMRQGKHLRRLSIGIIDKNERSIFVYEDKTSKFSNIQFAMRIISNNTIYDQKDASLLYFSP